MLPLGVIIAGLFLLLKDALPLMEAHRTGVVRTRGSRPQRVERAVEPERFARLAGQRFKALGGPAILILAGAGWIVLQIVGVVLQGR